MERLFFAFQIAAAWPCTYPKGRLIKESMRHLTLAFLQQQEKEKLLLHLQKDFPKPRFSLAPSALCNALLFLPEEQPRVAAYSLQWLSYQDSVNEYYQAIQLWLQQKHYPTASRPFLPHVTIAREPQELLSWQKGFSPFPAYASALHLYTSKPGSQYTPLWSHPFIAPFTEVPHTADLSFRILAETVEQLSLHAHLALAFSFPPITSYFPSHFFCQNLDEVIHSLNQTLFRCDCEIGAPFKAISYHGSLSQDESGLLSWTMVIDI